MAFGAPQNRFGVSRGDWADPESPGGLHALAGSAGPGLVVPAVLLGFLMHLLSAPSSKTAAGRLV